MHEMYPKKGREEKRVSGFSMVGVPRIMKLEGFTHLMYSTECFPCFFKALSRKASTEPGVDSIVYSKPTSRLEPSHIELLSCGPTYHTGTPPDVSSR